MDFQKDTMKEENVRQTQVKTRELQLEGSGTPPNLSSLFCSTTKILFVSMIEYTSRLSLSDSRIESSTSTSWEKVVH